MLLQPAYSEQFGLKLGALGDAGSGKTYSLTEIAIGLSKKYHGGAPIAFFDTEKQSDFIREMCEAENVPLLVVKSQSFIDLRDTFTEAEKECCAFIADSYTHPAIELHQAFKESADLVGRRTQFHHNDQPSQLWQEWVERWKASPLHCLFAARLGYRYGDVVDENGDVQHVKLDTKMRGDSGGGYEPNLVIEFEAVDDAEKRHVKSRSKKGITTHWLRVRKDRCQALNGRQFSFEDANGYRVGDYEKILTAIQPHLDKLAIGQQGLVRPESVSRRSTGLFTRPSGESKTAERARRIKIAIEAIDASMRALWPGETKDEKQMRLIVTKSLFQTRSWTEIETLTPEAVESGRAIMELAETAILDPDQQIAPLDQAKVIALLASCKDLESMRQANVSVGF